MMTGEKAIEELKKGVPQQWDWHRDRKAFKEAIEMGIEALELMGNPDTISREKMRRIIVDETKIDTRQDYVRVLDAIESVPSYTSYN